MKQLIKAWIKKQMQINSIKREISYQNMGIVRSTNIECLRTYRYFYEIYEKELTELKKKPRTEFIK